VKVKLMSPRLSPMSPNVNHCLSMFTQCRSRSINRIPTTKRESLWKSGYARSRRGVK
jgi:hypothetical protein